MMNVGQLKALCDRLAAAEGFHQYVTVPGVEPDDVAAVACTAHDRGWRVVAAYVNGFFVTLLLEWRL